MYDIMDTSDVERIPLTSGLRNLAMQVLAGEIQGILLHRASLLEIPDGEMASLADLWGGVSVMLEDYDLGIWSLSPVPQPSIKERP